LEIVCGGGVPVNSNLINLTQLMFLLMFFASTFIFAIYSYKSFKHKTEKNIVLNILIRWLEFIKKISPQDYMSYEKYGLWRFIGRFKIKMMF
jgi:hypothetical protein